MSNQNAKNTGFFKAWKNKREARKKEFEELAAMEITNDVAENEMKIISVLDSVDFLHSKLPKDILDYKKPGNEGHPCGDLEYAARALSIYLKNNPQSILMDVRPIDEKILELAYVFRDAVKDGEPRTASASKEFLTRGVREIRANIPSTLKENAKLYIDTYVNYLESCIAYCEQSRFADKMNDSCISDQAILEEEESRYKEQVSEFKRNIKEDRELASAFKTIANCEDSRERTSWSDVERDLHLDMVKQRMDGVTIDLKKTKYMQDQLSLAAAIARLDALDVKVQNIPIVLDPNHMNIFQEQIDDLFREFAKADLEIDESLRAIDDIEGRINQLNSAPGAERAKEIATEEAQKRLEEIKREQDEEIAKLKHKSDDILKSLGIRSNEEQDRLKAEVEALQAEEDHEVIEETSGEQLFN
ncbi:MAG: hypothetical protein IJ869_07345 [Clostridiales bacterium]|nr:hypothetical protein [Clostridiales bacterium]